MLLNSLESILSRLRRGKAARNQFVESHINKTLAYQIRATRDRLGWSQERLAKEVGMNQNAISRLESPEYGRPTITTLKRLASAFDVGLVVRFVPFNELAHWVSGTPHWSEGLATNSLAVPDFSTEEEGRALNRAAEFPLTDMTTVPKFPTNFVPEMTTTDSAGIPRKVQPKSDTVTFKSEYLRNYGI